MRRLLIAGSYELAGNVLGTITRLEAHLEGGLPSVDGWVDPWSDLRHTQYVPMRSSSV